MAWRRWTGPSDTTDNARQAGTLLAVGGLLLAGWVGSVAGWLDWAAVARWAANRAGSIVPLLVAVALLTAGGWLWLRRERPTRATPAPALSWWAVAGAGAVVAAVGWGATSWLLGEADQARDVAATRVEAIKTGLSIGAGTGGVFALLLAVRRQWHHELTAQGTAHDATERRMTELYIKAVEQLGSDKAPVRLGGLYALERLAQDSPDRRQTVINVLCAYLRMPFEPPDEIEDADGARTATQEQQVRMTAQRTMTLHMRPGPDSERPIGSYWPNIDLDLTGARLMHLSLRNCQLRSARFDRARFTGRTELDQISLARPALFRAAVFDDDATFRAARFEGDVVFSSAKMLGDVDFEGAHFGADASFDRSEFAEATGFVDTTFAKGALFRRAAFNGGTTFHGAKFRGAVRFGHARFRDTADFKDAAMSDSATFNGAAVLRRADASRTGLQE